MSSMASHAIFAPYHKVSAARICERNVNPPASGIFCKLQIRQLENLDDLAAQLNEINLFYFAQYNSNLRFDMISIQLKIFH